MNYLSDGLKIAAGDQMRVVLEKFTKNRVMAAITGAGVTAVFQSSSVTTVLVVGFVSAGVMSLSQSVGVIMGANIGSTMTAQIVAFSVEQYAPALIALGFFVNFVAKKDRTRHIGSILMELGLVFFGMGMMSHSMAPLRIFDPFIALMQAMAEKPLLAILIAALCTALVQLSSVTTSIIVVMAGEGLVSLEAGIAMALGADICTCATAALSAIGKPVEARRAAAVHVIFNVVGVLIWLPFISSLAQMAVSVSPSFPELDGLDRLAAEAPRQIANANTLFSILNTAVFLWFTTQIAQLAERLVPERKPPADAAVVPEFLNDAVLGTPSIALHAFRQETARFGDLAVEALGHIGNAVAGEDPSKLEDAKRALRRADALYPQIILFSSRLYETPMRDIDRSESQSLTLAVSELDLLADLLERRFLPLVAVRKPGALPPKMSELFGALSTAVGDATAAIRDPDVARAQGVIDAKAQAERMFDGVAATQEAGDFVADLEIALILRLMLMVTRRVARTVVFDATADPSDAPAIAS